MEHTLTDTSAAARLPRALAAPLGGGPSRVLPAALLGAALLHLFLILTVSFEMPKPGRTAPADQALEIVLLKDPGESTRNPEPDAALSQRSRVGESPRGDEVISSPEDQTPVPTAPLALDEPPAELLPAEPPDEPPDEEVAVTAPPPPIPARPPKPHPERLTAAPAPTPRPVTKDPEPAPAAAPVKPVDAAGILHSRDQEITRLTESLQARSAAYASRQRRRSVSASTREFRYASYLGAWARKVERIGNVNYPQAAKDQHLYGNLILSVAVRADGSVEQVRVVRSSGYPLLDQAAIRIVELAAPYSAFPPDIAAETDVLDIVRTWQFLRGGKLAWE